MKWYWIIAIIVGAIALGVGIYKVMNRNKKIKDTPTPVEDAGSSSVTE